MKNRIPARHIPGVTVPREPPKDEVSITISLDRICFTGEIATREGLRRIVGLLTELVGDIDR